jgi:hypothetical protein
MKPQTKSEEEMRQTCKTQWCANKNDRVSDLRKLFTAYRDGCEEKYADQLGVFSEYGLSFDYVPPGTFDQQPEGYWRYQISWGGPSDEFRFYASGCGNHDPYRICYVFMDWFDGHERAMAGRDCDLLRDIWEHFRETGLTTSEYRKYRA